MVIGEGTPTELVPSGFALAVPSFPSEDVQHRLHKCLEIDYIVQCRRLE